MPDGTLEPVPDDVPLTFPELLSYQRIHLKMTQRAIAEGLQALGFDYTSQSISQWETGLHPPRTADVVYALEEVMDCPGLFSEALGLAPSNAGRSRFHDLEARVAALELQIRDLISEIRSDP